MKTFKHGLMFFGVCAYMIICSVFTFPPTADAATLQKPPNNLGLLLYYSFNEGTSTVATDFSGNRNHGTLNTFSAPASATSGWGSGKLGGGLNFDGSSDYVSGTDIDFSSGPFTVSLWFKTTTASDMRMLSKRLDVGNQIWLMVLSDGLVEVGLHDGSDSVISNSGTAFNDGVWHHVIMLVDSSNVTLYVDGNAKTPAAHDNVFPTNDVVWRVGARNDGVEFFNGSIDEVRIYNRALGAPEIRSLYQSGVAKINSSQNNVLTNGLVGLWSFDGADVTDKVYDRSGQNNNGYFYSGPTSTAKTIGKLGQALSLDGSDDVVRVEDPGSGSLDFGSATNFTISTWIKTSTINRGLIAKENESVDPGFMIRIDDLNRVMARIGNPSISCIIGSSVDPVVGRWVHIVAVFNRNSSCTTSDILLYFDGVRDADAFVDTNSTNTTINISNSAPLIIGARNDAAPYSVLLGQIDDTRIYNRALSAFEIKQLYNMGGSKINSGASQTISTTLQTGLVGYWSFNGPDVTDKVYDRSGSSNNGYFINNATSTAKTIGKTGQGLTFDGVNDYVDAGDPASNGFDFEKNQPFSLSGWIYRRSGASNQGIFFKRTSTGAGYDFTLTSANLVGLNITTNAGSSENLGVLTVATINTLQWYHVTVTYDGSLVPGGMKIYIDGVDQSVTTASNALGAGSILNAIPLTMGDRAEGGRPFPGKLDEMRVYNRVLSASEVKQLYLLGK